MTREQIEEASEKHSEQWLDNSDEYFRSHHRDVYEYGFIAGAQWRINSVWHDVKEIPNTGKYVLIQLAGSERVMILFFLRKRNYLSFIKRESVIGWAYVSDLLPERKEVVNDTESRGIPSSL